MKDFSLLKMLMLILTPLLKKEKWLFSRSHIRIHKWSKNNWISLFIAGEEGVASYLEMFIPFFFNQRIVLNCNCVPHVVFLKKCFLPICFNMTPPYPGMTLILSWLVFIAFLCKKRGLKCLLRIKGRGAWH